MPTPHTRSSSPKRWKVFKYKGFVTDGTRVTGSGRGVWKPRCGWTCRPIPWRPCPCPGPLCRMPRGRGSCERSWRGCRGAGSHHGAALASLLLRATRSLTLAAGRWLGLPGRCVGGHRAGAGPSPRKQWLALGGLLGGWGLCQEGRGVPRRGRALSSAWQRLGGLLLLQGALLPLLGLLAWLLLALEGGPGLSHLLCLGLASCPGTSLVRIQIHLSPLGLLPSTPPLPQ